MIHIQNKPKTILINNTKLALTYHWPFLVWAVGTHQGVVEDLNLIITMLT